MIRNYIKIALRNLFRQKAFSIINILGLSIGLAYSIIILLYIKNELCYDSFHDNAGTIYRITAEANDISVAISPAPLGPAIFIDYFLCDRLVHSECRVPESIAGKSC